MGMIPIIIGLVIAGVTYYFLSSKEQQATINENIQDTGQRLLAGIPFVGKDEQNRPFIKWPDGIKFIATYAPGTKTYSAAGLANNPGNVTYTDKYANYIGAYEVV